MDEREKDLASEDKTPLEGANSEAAEESAKAGLETKVETDNEPESVSELNPNQVNDEELGVNAGSAPQPEAAPVDSSVDEKTASEKPSSKSDKVPVYKKPKVLIGVGIVSLVVIFGVLFGTHIICFHNWQEATCIKPKTCSICEKTDGSSLGHSVSEWKVTADPTCHTTGSETGVCKRCGSNVAKPLNQLEHIEGDWSVTTKSTVNDDGSISAGKKQLLCSLCGDPLETEEFYMTEAQAKKAYKESCKSYSYEKIFRDADKYDGKRAKFKGEVIQVLEDSGEYTMRVNVTKGSYGIWKDTIMVTYKAESGESRILEDDIVTFYGVLDGLYSYEAIYGQTVTVPLMHAAFIAM